MSALLNPKSPEGWTAWDYADAILDRLDRLEDATGTTPDPPVTRLRRPFVIQTDASGNGQVLFPLASGNAWSLLTLAFQIPFPGAASGYVAFYRDVEEGTGLIKVVTAATLVDDAFNAEAHFIPEQSSLLVVARGVLANSAVSGNVAAKSIQNAVPTHRRDGGGEF